LSTTDISRIAHLAWAVHPGIRLSCIEMAVVTSYYDASGDESDLQAITVGGFIGDVGAWNRFSGRWPEALKVHGITVPFRMTSFINGTPGFERFKDRPDLQTTVLRDLVKVINRHTRISVSSTVLTEDWKAINREYRLKECHCTPYAVAAFAVINKSIRWIGKKKLKFIEFVFEEGDAGRDDFEWLSNDIIRRRPDALEAMRPRFDSKALPPLQCADLAVWEQRNVVRERLKGVLSAKPVHRDQRPVIRRLLARPNDWGIMTRLRIADWASRSVGVPKRSEAWDRKTWRPFPPLARKGLA
jgi:hypothetical protein